jgi:hypothetical protein
MIGYALLIAAAILAYGLFSFAIGLRIGALIARRERRQRGRVIYG